MLKGETKMAFMISKFYGVPMTMNTALEQFEQLKEEEDNPYNKGSYLVLKIQKDGVYKGLPVNYIYENKPQGKYIKIYQFNN